MVIEAYGALYIQLSVKISNTKQNPEYVALNQEIYILSS